MYKHKIYLSSIKKKASSSSALSKRLDVNKKYSKKDLTEWLFSKYNLKKNFNILEVGCGLGQHVIKESNIIGTKGYILAIDNSKESISELNKNKLKNVETICMEMDLLPSLLQKKNIYYDRILSSYAIYYANDPLILIRKLIPFLKPNGELIITMPNTPHTLIQMITSKEKIPLNVTQSLYFGKNILKPYLKNNYKNVKFLNFKNELKFKEFNDFYNLYKSSTFFLKKKEKKIKNYLIKNFNKSIKNYGYFLSKKSALTIILKNISK